MFEWQSDDGDSVWIAGDWELNLVRIQHLGMSCDNVARLETNSGAAVLPQWDIG